MNTQRDPSLHLENERLRERLAELEDTLEAIRNGHVDALVNGTDLFILESAESASNRFRGQVLQQVSEAVIALDNDHHITYINEAAEKQYGRRSADVLGLQVNELYETRWAHPEDEQAAMASLNDHGHWRGENIQVTRNGEVLHVESMMKVLRDAEGSAIGLLSVTRDITQRVKDRNALEESARQKDHFLATLAHELRNPLSPLMNGLQLLEAATDPALVESTRQMMLRQLNHMVRLVDDLMDLSRISRGKLVLRKAVMDLTHIVNTAVETSMPLMKGQHHRFDLRVSPGTYLVNGDSTRLAQVLSNLLNNAAKYTPPGGRIELRMERDGDHAVLRVKDNGIGIDPASIEGIFDMFTQVDGSIQGAGGLGIGLNISKRLTAMHNGTLEAHSEGAGHGSEFVLRLPLAEVPTPSRANVQEASAPPVPSLRILVVDDNLDGALSLSMVLRKTGNEVEVAHNGAQALEVGAMFRPDVVFMDLGMPIMDGYEACQHMRGSPWGQRARIVAVSGWGQEGDRERSRMSGFDEHIVKPIERHTLQRVIQSVAAERAAGK